jgi:hypothetical protein
MNWSVLIEETLRRSDKGPSNRFRASVEIFARFAANDHASATVPND